MDEINMTDEEYVKVDSKDKVEVLTKNQKTFRSLCGVLMVFLSTILLVDFFTNDDGTSLFWALVLGIWGIKLIYKSRTIEPKNPISSKKLDNNVTETGTNVFKVLLILFVIGVGIALIVALGPLWIIAILLFFLILK
jgi:archaellum biogenesis protein FlaJ (TadC family)